MAEDLEDDLLVIGVEDGGIVAHVFRRLPGAVGATASGASRCGFRGSVLRRLVVGLGGGVRLRLLSILGCGLSGRRGRLGSTSVIVIIVVAAAGEDGGGAGSGNAGARQEAAAAQLAATQSQPVVVPISHLVSSSPAMTDSARTDAASTILPAGITNQRVNR
ncbi:MAG: hypothetical protein F4X89_13490 [Dehalococcoidia bacterium]|nr:hypothetical protein [Dehalococcoidia bacterium]